MEKVPETNSQYQESTAPHGTLEDIAGRLKETPDALRYLIDSLPKRASELYELSEKDEVAQKMFRALVKQSFKYLDTVFELQEEIEKNSGVEERTIKDEARGRTHTATIDSVNAWSRSLAKAGIDNNFLRGILGQDRAPYSAFAIGLALDVYTNGDLFQKLTE